MNKRIEISENPRVDKNIDFLEWYLKVVQRGYLPALNVEEMQHFVDFITEWYEIKYTDSFLASVSLNIVAENQKDDLARMMDMETLKTRLNQAERDFLEGRYRMGNGTNFEDQTISISILDELGMPHYITVRTFDGEIIGDLGVFAAVKKKGQSLKVEELLDLLSHRESPYDCSILKRVVRTHEIDLQVREALFRFITLNLKNGKKIISASRGVTVFEQTVNKAQADLRQKRATQWRYEISRHFTSHLDPELAYLDHICEAEDTVLEDRRADRLKTKINRLICANYSPLKK